MDVVDIFGPWHDLEDYTLADLTGTCLPPPLVELEDVLEAHVELDETNSISYRGFDARRVRHGIDVTALSASLTRGGNAYRAFVLSGGSTLK